MSTLLPRHWEIISGLVELWLTGSAPASLYPLITDSVALDSQSLASFFDTVFKDLDKYGRRRYSHATGKEFAGYLVERCEHLLNLPELDAAAQAAREEAKRRAVPEAAEAAQRLLLLRESLRDPHEALTLTHPQSREDPRALNGCAVCLFSGWISIETDAGALRQPCWKCGGRGYI